MAGTTTTTLTELVPQILGEAQMWFVDKSLFMPKTGIAEQFLQWRDLRNSPGLTATFPKYTAVTMGDGTEGTDYSSISVLDTSGPGSVTAAEKVINVLISDLAVDSVQGGPGQLIADCGRAIGTAAATKFDGDVMALFASLTAAITGSFATTTPVTQAKFRRAISGLESVPVPGPYAAFFHPNGWEDFLAESTTPLLNAAASDAIAREIWKSDFAANILGVNCFKHSKVPAATTVDWVGGFMSSYAIGCVWKGDLKIEPQRDATLRGTEFVGVMKYGVGVIDATAGYIMLHDYRV